MNMQTMIVQQLVNALLLFLSPEVMKKGLDSLLDVVEESVIKSETKIDDMVLLSICSQARRAFDVADNDAL